MKTNEIIERSQKFITSYRVTDGKKFRLKDIDPGDTGEATSEDKPRAKELLGKGIAVTGRVLRAGSMVGAPNLSGHGRGGKRWRDQACHVWHQSAGVTAMRHHRIEYPEQIEVHHAKMHGFRLDIILAIFGFAFIQRS